MTLLYQSKFYPPPIPGGFVVRTQLLGLLDEVLNHTLTLISAPAGSGKTTLVSAWVKSIHKLDDHNIGWLSLDSGDNSTEVFCEYLVGCLEEGGVTFDQLDSQLSNWQASGFVESISKIPLLFSYLDRQLILILDEYQQIRNPTIHEFISELIEHASPLLHLIIITRSDPPFALARMRLRGQLSEIRMDTLRFSNADAAKYLNHQLKIPLSDREVDILNSRTEGWIAGLQLAAISLRNQGEPSSFVNSFAGSHRYVFDYLLEQVLNHQPPEVKSFLLKTSILGRLSQKLCDFLMDIDHSQNILESLERDNLFLVPLDEERKWYRYHQLFSDLLKLMLDQTFPGLDVELHRKASGWFESQGMVSDAVEHAFDAGDMELTARLISENVLALVEYSELTPILQKMESISFDQRKSIPWIDVAYAWVLAYAGQIDRAERTLHEAEENINNIPIHELSRFSGHIQVVRGYLTWVVGNQSEALAFTQSADEILPKNEISVRAMNLITLGNSINQFSPSWEAVNVLEQALVLAKQANKPQLLMLAASGLAYGLIILGQLDKAKRICEEALGVSEQFRKQSGQPLYSTAIIYAELSKIQCEWGDCVEALRSARKGTWLANRWAQSDSLVVCTLNEIIALICLNEMEEANSLLQRVKKISLNISNWFVSNVQQLELFFWLEKGEPEKADLVFKYAVGEMPVSLQARILIAQGRLDDAINLLGQSYKEEDNISSVEDCRVMLMWALAWFKKSNTDKALNFLKKSIEFAQEENIFQSFVLRNTGMEELLQNAYRKRIQPAFTEKLLDRYATQFLKTNNPTESDLIDPISDRELQVLKLLDSHYSTPEIAEQLFLSANTVRTHIKNIYSKLNVHGRSEAVKRAKDLNFIN